MELKTKIHTVEGGHDITVTREFDLPVALLFKAYVEAEAKDDIHPSVPPNPHSPSAQGAGGR